MGVAPQLPHLLEGVVPGEAVQGVGGEVAMVYIPWYERFRLAGSNAQPADTQPIPAPPITDIQERILGVAVRLDGGFLFQAPAPNRHEHLLNKLHLIHNEPLECGFYSNHRVWLTRREAYFVAKASGQYIEDRPFARTHEVLMSEDVW